MAGPRITDEAASPVPGDRFDVMVLDCGSRQGLAYVRGLGRLGLRVLAGECYVECDARLPVLGFRSRYAAAALCLTSYAANPRAFATEVCTTARRHGIQLVVPASDGSIAAMLPVRHILEQSGTRLSLASSGAVATANDKNSTLEVADKLGIRTPRTMRIQSMEDVDDVVSAMSFPLVLKPRTSWGERSTSRLQSVDVAGVQECRRVARELLVSGSGCLAQEVIGGSREGVTLFVAGNELAGAFAHHEIRTTPALGGAAVLRESIPLPQDTFGDSVRLVREMGLEGLSEVEFRRDVAGTPYLMEINARPPGVLELAAAAGVDFPRMTWEWYSGRSLASAPAYRSGVRMRWLRGDMRWLRDNGARKGRVDATSRPKALALFAGEFLRGSRYDCFSMDDPGPLVAELVTTANAVKLGWRPQAMPIPTRTEGADAY